MSAEERDLKASSKSHRVGDGGEWPAQLRDDGDAMLKAVRGPSGKARSALPNIRQQHCTKLSASSSRVRALAVSEMLL